MIDVECCSGYKVNERPVSFRLVHQTYQVSEILDRWYGASSVYFKIMADDENIYLLKYNESQDFWDLVFYQNPRKLGGTAPQVYGLEKFTPMRSVRNSLNPKTFLN
tara:strand:- start:12864 stop:13181 length:318 start_codon:yes stop_codon:yes gene_type:complete